jgi:hypothetical protein
VPRFHNPIVSTADLADGSVTTPKLADGAVSTIKIANLAVTSAKIANATITDAQIGSLNADKITAGSITALRYRTAATGDRLEIRGDLAESFVQVFSGSTFIGAIGVGVGFGISAGTLAMVADTTDLMLKADGGAGDDVLIHSEAGKVQIFAPAATASQNVQIGFDGRVRAGDGSAGSPSLSFVFDSDTGLYSPTANQMAAVTGGAERLRLRTDFLLSAGGVTGSATLKVDGAGSVSAPAFTFGADPDTGIYRQGVNSLSVASGGGERLRVDNNGVWIRTAGTTASAANTFLDSSNLILKVTSSRRWKTAIREWDRRESVLDLTPVTFRSTLAGDDGRKVFLGLLAEDVAARFPRAALYDAEGRPEAINWAALTTGLLAEVIALDARVAALE